MLPMKEQQSHRDIGGADENCGVNSLLLRPVSPRVITFVLVAVILMVTGYTAFSVGRFSGLTTSSVRDLYD